MIKHIYIEANVDQEKDTSENKKSLLERIYLVDEDGKITTIDRAAENKSYEEFEEYVSNKLVETFGDTPERGTEWDVYCRDEKKYPNGTSVLNNLDETKKKQKEEEAKEYANLQVNKEAFNGKKAVIVAGALIGTAVIGLGGCQVIKNRNANTNINDNNNTVTEATVEDENIQALVVDSVSLDGKDWAFYKENAAATDQKDFYNSLGEYLLNYNCNEAWETITLTDEQIDQINEIGNFKLEKGNDNVQRIALKPAELRAFMATFGNYTPEQLASIYHNETINLEEEMLGKDSNVDGALTYFIAYALNSKDQDFHFEDIKGLFDEKEMEDIKYWQDQHREYINLVESGQLKEAEAKMRDIRKDFELYLRRTDNDSDAKAFVATVYNGVFLNESNIAGYTHDIITYADDNYTGEIVEITVKNRQLFDEEFEAFVNNGFGSPCYENGNIVSGFDGEALIKAAGKSTDRLSYHRPTDLTSYVDKGAKSRVEKINAGNDYIANPANEAKAKEGGYEKEQIEELIQNELVKQNKDAHYNEGIMFSEFSAFKQRFAEILANVKGTVKAGATSVKGLIGQGYKRVISKTITNTTTSKVEWEESVDRAEVEKQFNSIAEEAKKGNTKVTVKDGKTGKDKETTAQDAVDAAYDHYADGKDKKGSDVEYDDSWKHGNEDERRADEIGKEYGEKRKKAEEEAEKDEKRRYTDDNGVVHHESGGDVTIDPEYADVIIFDEPQEPQSSPVVEEQPEEGFTNVDPTDGNPDFGWVMSTSEEEETKKTR